MSGLTVHSYRRHAAAVHAAVASSFIITLFVALTCHPAFAADLKENAWRRSARFGRLFYLSPTSPSRYACAFSGAAIVTYKQTGKAVFVAPAFPKQEADLLRLKRLLKRSKSLPRTGQTLTLEARLEKLRNFFDLRWKRFCALSPAVTPTAAPTKQSELPGAVLPTSTPIVVPTRPPVESATVTPTAAPRRSVIPDSASLARYDAAPSRYDLFTLVNKALNGPDYDACGTRGISDWAFDFCSLETFFNANGLERTVDLVTTWSTPAPAEKTVANYLINAGADAPGLYTNPLQARQATVLRAAGRNPFFARVWLFLYGLWTVSGEQWRDTSFMDLHFPYYDMLYRFAQDPELNIRAMLPLVMDHPAMAKFLDRDGSVRTIVLNGAILSKANENFPREFWELFTLGTNHITDNENPDGTCALGSENYTDAIKRGFDSDIAKAAQIWSGYFVKASAIAGMGDFPRTYTLEFNPTNGPVKSETLFSGTAWQRTVSTPAELIDATLNHPNASLYLAQELLREFVNQKPPCPLVHQVASSIRRNDFRLKPVLREIFLSKAFYHQANRFKSAKSALDMYVSLVRLLGLNVYTAHAQQFLAKLNMANDGAATQFAPLDAVQPPQFPVNQVFYYDPVSAFHSYGAVYGLSIFSGWTLSANHLLPSMFWVDGKIVAPQWLVPNGSSPSSFIVNLLERVGLRVDDLSPDSLSTMLFYLQNRRNADGSYIQLTQPFIGKNIDSMTALRLYWMVYANTHAFHGR